MEVIPGKCICQNREGGGFDLAGKGSRHLLSVPKMETLLPYAESTPDD